MNNGYQPVKMPQLHKWYEPVKNPNGFDPVKSLEFLSETVKRNKGIMWGHWILPESCVWRDVTTDNRLNVLHAYINYVETDINVYFKDVNAIEDERFTVKNNFIFGDIEAIDIIASSMTIEQFEGYCLGNFLKYRLRACKKDIDKSDQYIKIFKSHKKLCKC